MESSVLVCFLITVLASLGALRALWAIEPDSFQPDLPHSSPAHLCFRASCATAWCFTLAHSYLDQNGLQISHRGRVVTVRHSARFVTFTLWCNAVITLYWLCATAGSSLAALGARGAAARRLATLSLVLWEIAFPLSWLVALVVSFVLIPAAVRKEPEKVEVLLRWRPQVLHNGYVLACACELVLAKPPMVSAHFPLMILFGTGYIAFAWAMHARLGVYAYFFLDPTFSWSPIAYAALLLVTSGCFAGCFVLTADVQALDSPGASSVAVLGAALATCTWRKPAARP
jgi:hypothetical protein